MRKTLLNTLLILSVFRATAGTPVMPDALTRGTDQFIENKGQMVDMNGNPVPFVLFSREAKGLNVYITEKGLTYVFLKYREEEAGGKRSPYKMRAEREKEKTETEWERVDMRLEGATIRKENIVTDGASESFTQYFLAHCPQGITKVRRYDKITIQNVYPGIDWVFYNSTERGAKYDFIVHPGADPALIRMVYSSREKLSITEEGMLGVKTAYGSLMEAAPESFLEEEPVESRFHLLSSENDLKGGTEVTVGFQFPNSQLPTPNSQTLRIDPQLYWATFFGGSGFDGPRCVQPDNAGNIYVTGYTESVNFPTQNGGGYYQGTAGGGIRDMFIQKFTPAGVRLWATYYGGNLTDEGWSIAVDNADNIFVFGYSESANFPTLNAGTFYQGTYAGQGDAIIVKFNSAGVRLWATYYGGVNMEEGFGITTDAAGNIFATGETRSATTFPLLNPGGGAFYQGTFGTGTSDAFFLKFDNAGNRIWSTFAGGWNTDMGFAITTDAAGNVFATGHVWGGGFPLLNPGGGAFYQGTLTGSGDLFIMKFTNAGVLLWSTYYGGGAVDEGNSIVCDAAGNIFITGSTASGATFPTFNPGGGAYFKGTKGGTWDTYMLKFSNNGTRLWATFFGGSGDETTKEYTYDNLALDDCGNVYMTFETTSSDVITLQSCDNGYFDNSFSGGTYDMFITQFSNTGVYLWGTYFGGDGDDFRTPIGIDNTNSLFVSGEWTDGSPITPATYPLTNPGGGSYNATYAGGHDGVMSKFTKVVPTLSVTPVNATCGCTGSATANPSGICSPFVYLWSNGQTTQTATGLCAGTYSVTVGNSLCGTVTNNSVTITSSGGFTVTPSSTPAACLAANGSATVTPSGGQTPFTYSWSPSGGTNPTATGLAAGNYTVSVTDANGCTNSVTVAVTTSGSFTTSASSTPAACLSTNGSATVTLTGGTSPFTYSWSPAGGTNATATGLASGNYTASVTDANGCTGTVTVTVTSTGGPALALSNQTNVSCNGGTNGTAVMTASSGTSPYTFSWSPSGGTTSAATGLSAGSYTATVTDVNGCVQTQTVTITQPTALTATTTAVAATCGNNNGSASVSAGGGTSPYSYSWSTGGTTSQISNLTSQTYSVTITDGNNCTVVQTVSVATTGSVTASVNNAAICPGQTATLTASGGSTYSWSTGATTSSISAAPTVTATYSVIVSTGGCSDTTSATVTVNTAPNANAGNNMTVCTGSVVTLSATGGGTYLWNTGQTSVSITASAASNTTYTVTVTNASGCTDVATVSVFTTPSIVANAGPDQTICVGNMTPLNASGGTGYSWIPATGLSNPNINNPIASPTATTTYTVVVTSGSCAPATDMVTVVVNPNITTTVTGSTVIQPGQTVTIAASGGVTYSWNNGATGSVINVSPLITTQYCATVTDANGCSDSACVTVFVEPTNCSPMASEDAFVLPSAFSPNADGENDRWRLLYVPLMLDCIDEFQIAVYSRWGERVFEATGISFAWDGTYNGEPEGTAVFAYYLDAVMKDGTKIKKKGNVSLLR